MKRVLAISGGVDSMVMLEIMTAKFPQGELIVAHFNHGIRDNASEDADFVREICEQKGLVFRLGEAKLGEKASEADARAARYDFLKKVAMDEGGEIYMAHHLDDLVGTVAINLLRGTGWRGLAAMSMEGVKRPFLENYHELGFDEPPDKKALLKYAGEKELCFREDPSNSWDEYLRNRLYHGVNNFSEKVKIFELWRQQKKLRDEIDQIANKIMPDGKWPREWFRQMDDDVAIEILKTRVPATRPQLLDFLWAIRNYAPGKKFNLPGDILVKIGKNDFEI